MHGSLPGHDVVATKWVTIYLPRTGSHSIVLTSPGPWPPGLYDEYSIEQDFCFVVILR